ncbi:MAG: hypothetical protein Q7T76_01170 [Ferruginibacter sp.]|nr:hypothetical protein [Ferruginibacter sp.]
MLNSSAANLYAEAFSGAKVSAFFDKNNSSKFVKTLAFTGASRAKMKLIFEPNSPGEDLDNYE